MSESTTAHPNSHLKIVFRWVAALLFIAAGINHFVSPDNYRKIIPPMFPAPNVLVILSGIAEIAGGIGLLIPRLRRIAMWGLIAMLVAVFPANLYMAFTSERAATFWLPAWLLWLRLPLQGVLIAWVWKVK